MLVAFSLKLDLAAATQHKPTGDGKYPPGQEGACPAGGSIKNEFTHAP